VCSQTQPLSSGDVLWFASSEVCTAVVRLLEKLVPSLRGPFTVDYQQQVTHETWVPSLSGTSTILLAEDPMAQDSLSPYVRHRVSFEVLPIWHAAFSRDTRAFRRALLLRVEAIGAPDAVGFRGRSRRVLVRVDRAKRAVVDAPALFLHPVRSFRTLLGKSSGIGCSGAAAGGARCLWPCVPARGERSGGFFYVVFCGAVEFSPFPSLICWNVCKQINTVSERPSWRRDFDPWL